VTPSPVNAIPTLAVVGAGFSGTMVTVQLLRRLAGTPCRVVLINRSGPMARGVAYGTRSSRHVLNVPAGRMSAFPDDEDSFLRFARADMPEVTGGTFVPRRIYGNYLAHILQETAAAGGTAQLEQIAGEVVDIEAVGRQGHISLKGGRSLLADRIILALGNYPPANIPIPNRAFFDGRLYVGDPWGAGALDAIPTDRPVLLIGSGLTMLDIALELNDRGRSAPMTALSRRGLVPLPHRGHGSPPSYSHLPPSLIACEPMAVEYLKAVRQHVRILARSGVDWREVVASLRPLTPRLWQALNPREKARFLRHLRPHWDVHRHRVAPELYQEFETLRSRGQLTIRAGRVLDMREDGNDARALVRARGSAVVEELAFGAVVNCTGPEGDVRTLADPLIQQLLRRGLARTDEMGIGLEVTSELALLEEDGRASQLLSLVGPLLKGSLWEATAVPELRVHAANVAARVCASLEAAHPDARATAQLP
jgi:uncharacterized NAD(P)/FAD-binding protein YdhS